MSVQVQPDVKELTKRLAAAIVPDVGGATVHSREVAGGVHYLYESVRNATEFRDQHLFLRRAIERFLRRQLRLGRGLNGLGKELVVELINTRYLRNDSFPVATVKQIDALLVHYSALQAAALQHGRTAQLAIIEQLLEIASTDVERLVLPRPKDEVMLAFTFDSFQQHMAADQLAALGNQRLEFDMALLAAIHRSLLKSDIAVIRYGIFERLHPNWQHSQEALSAAAADFVSANQLVDHVVGGNRIATIANRVVRRNVVPYMVLRQALVEATNPSELVAEPVRLGGRISTICQQQYRAADRKLRDGIIRSIIFLMVTKGILTIVLEIPYDLLRHGSIQWLPLVINFMVPLLYMLTLTLTVRTPSPRNTQRIREGVEALVYEPSEGSQPLRYLMPQRPDSRRSVGFNVAYAITIAITFGLLCWALYLLHFNIVSAAIFFIFLSTVSFLGFRVSQAASELVVLERRRGFWASLGDFFYTPFIQVGQYLASRYARVNLVGVVLDIAIELPLKTVLRIFERWSSFLRDKREDIY